MAHQSRYRKAWQWICGGGRELADLWWLDFVSCILYLFQAASSMYVLYSDSMAFTANVPPSTLRTLWWTVDVYPASLPVDTTADSGGCSLPWVVRAPLSSLYVLLPHALSQSLNNLISETTFLLQCRTHQEELVVFGAYESTRSEALFDLLHSDIHRKVSNILWPAHSSMHLRYSVYFQDDSYSFP